jgi:hypothetical protein
MSKGCGRFTPGGDRLHVEKRMALLLLQPVLDSFELAGGWGKGSVGCKVRRLFPCHTTDCQRCLAIAYFDSCVGR